MTLKIIFFIFTTLLVFLAGISDFFAFKSKKYIDAAMICASTIILIVLALITYFTLNPHCKYCNKPLNQNTQHYYCVSCREVYKDEDLICKNCYSKEHNRKYCMKCKVILEKL